MKRRITSRLLGLILFAFALQALQVRAEQLPIKTYTIADGLARDYVNRIRLDSHGFIWFCTAEGISRFDGYAFTNYGVNDGLPHRIVNDFLETSDGIYWFGTDGGLVQFSPQSVNPQGSHFTIIPLDDNEPSKYVVRLLEDPDGALWCGTANGLYRVTRSAGGWQSSFISKELAHGVTIPAINTLAIDRQGSLWIGTPGDGLFRRWRDGNVEHYTIKEGLSQDGISDVLIDHDGRVWVGTGTGLTFLVKDPRPNESVAERVYKTKDGLLGEFIECLYQSSDNRIWVGTRSGLHLFVDPKANRGLPFVGYNTANGLRNIKIQSIIEDKDRNLWLGAESGGAMKIPLSGFTSYFESDGLGNGRISQIFSDHEHNVYVLCNPYGVSSPVIVRFNGPGFVKESPNLPPHVQLTWGWNQLILQDHQGDWWIPLENGLYRFTGNRSFDELAHVQSRVYVVKEGTRADGIFRAFEDAHGDIWFGTLSNGIHALHRWERSSDTIHVYTPQDNIPIGGPTAFANDSEGNLWLGFYDGGIARYKDGRFTLFTEKDGIPGGFVRHLFFDSQKRLWIATSYNGVARVDNPQAEKPDFKIITTKDGISSNQVTTVTEDRWGRIYLGTGRGIDRLDPETGKLRHFTIADGLADDFINVSYCDSQGVLWFGTLRGLSRFVPEPDKLRAPPSILIGNLRVAGVKQTISDLGQAEVLLSDLNYTQNDLQIDFLSLSYAAGDIIRYQFKFEGSSSDWSAPSDQRTITLPNLLPGNYRLLVRAMNSDGVVSVRPASLSFRILPPLWKRWWFLTAVTLLILVILFSIYRYRLARLREINLALAEAKRAEENLGKAREERLTELARVRTRIATDLHDDIGASLTQIAILSEVAKQQSMKANGSSMEPLNSIVNVSNELVETMSDIVWAINPRKDHLQDLIQRMRRFASDILTARGIALEFNAPTFAPEIPLGVNARREVFLIFKESLTNIVKHARATQVKIEFDFSQNYLTLKITDNGQGFDIDHLAPALLRQSKGGHGILSIKKRATEMNAILEIDSRISHGTSITFRLPLSAAQPISDGSAIRAG